jgi:hypothetical protein
MSKEAAAKVLDENDEAFICYCSVQTLDRDGIGIKTKGSSVGAPVHMVSEPGADPVVMKAVFDPNDPLFYLEVRNEEQFYLFGQLWMDSAKHSEDKAFCTLTPIMTQGIHKAMEKNKTASFALQAQCPYIKDCTSKPIKMEGTTVEKKFTTKLSGIKLEIPRADWMEYKNYRLRGWRVGKNWAGAGDDKKDDKDKEKKEGEEEEGKKEES